MEIEALNITVSAAAGYQSAELTPVSSSLKAAINSANRKIPRLQRDRKRQT